ncbi:hypothetical protein [Streptomyces sp. NPDC002994]|uniref:hypothetical protein n=1 Tax=Streptomyces sp. NPDC002994 TaxID=3154441 RepID=UPI0033B44B00
MLAAKAHELLEAARNAAEDRRPLMFPGSSIDRAVASVHEAELILLQLAADEELAWRGPVVLAQGMHHLGQEDPRLQLLAEHLQRNRNRLTGEYRDLAISVLHAANHVEESEISRVRSFRNVLLVAFFATAVITVLFILSGYDNPRALADKLCFDPPNPRQPGEIMHVCPVGNGEARGGDVLLVASLGMTAAALTGAASVRHIQGTVTPYMVPLALLLLRLPIGALSALLGLILIHGEFIPGLSQLDSSAQIAAWAVAFGIGQEALTRMIDRQGNAVLENVRGSWREFDTPPPTPEELTADLPRPAPHPTQPPAPEPAPAPAPAPEPSRSPMSWFRIKTPKRPR